MSLLPQSDDPLSCLKPGRREASLMPRAGEGWIGGAAILPGGGVRA